MASDASHMLEAALEQMDGIIAGSRIVGPEGPAGLAAGVLVERRPSARVLRLAEELRGSLDAQACVEDREALRRQVPTATTHTLLMWLDQGLVNLRRLESSESGESYQERLSRLEGDKESLVLQVSVLTDQVEAQGEKIRDLENSLEEHQHKLNSTEEMLQQELLSRTALETQKLDLMDEVSFLKLKLVGMEERQNHATERQQNAEGLLQELRLLKNKVNVLEDEKSQCERKLKATKLSVSCSLHVCYQSLVTQLSSLRLSVEHLQVEKQQWEERSRRLQVEISSLQQLLQCKNAEIETLQTQLLARAPVSVDSSEREEIYRRRLHSKHQELQKLKAGMELLIAANDEKDRRIEELSLLLSQCRQFRDGTTLSQPPALTTAQISSEEDEKNGGVRTKDLAVTAHSELTSSVSSPLLASTMSTHKETELRSQPRHLSSSMEDLKGGVAQKAVSGTPLQSVCSEKTAHSDFRPQMGVITQTEGTMSDTLGPKAPESNENSDLNLLRCRSASAPVLGKTERLQDTSTSDSSPVLSRGDSDQQSPVPQEAVRSNKSIRRLWGRIRRTQSGGLQGDDLEPTEFRRGGFRATAGPRLARTPDSARAARDMTVPFSKWTTEQVCGWLEDYGLGQYVNLTRQWVASGQTLLLATPQEFEKEMGIKHPLHRKKLQLALRSFTSKTMEKSSELDHIWVTRWLDDIGLPQYKDQFHESRVDGRMLQYLTVNDLLFLKVTSQLHHLSVKCAIHVLHVNKFNPYCLRRRPGDENKTSPSEVVQWSNHRVMEWLRSVDLAEYAPNLRGSGVHGGLIILEPRFSSETLAMLLNIPPQKTLLRRHLATNFNNLVGTQAQQEKREYANASGHTPLTATAKVRPKKLGFTNFSHLRKRRPDDSADYICPVEADASPVLNGNPHHTQAGFRDLSPITDIVRVDQVGPKS
ncbi:liprin-beta-2 isoform X7 [Brachyhypopomus gauderio]|uniref:liprin-beta-2 isoform X7 n=1 Tax=Brachyhypopomus gauderio TaxID=698409 RepID=UPI0040429C33